jgi:hypothetical protein
MMSGGWFGGVDGLVGLDSVAFPGGAAVGGDDVGFGDEGVDVVAEG